MRIAMVYFKDPSKSLDGMDTIRWLELSRALARLGYDVEMVTEEGEDVELSKRLRVRNISLARWGTYNVVKTTHHTDVFAVPEHPFLICRVGRVVDELHPQRVYRHRQELLQAQDLIAGRAKRAVLMCEENLQRWQKHYPAGPPGVVVPNGCPTTIPNVGPSPYDGTGKRALYLGSLTSSRFVQVLNSLGRLLKDRGVEVHHVGRSQLELYGESDEQLDPMAVISHGAFPEPQSWDYLFHADVGLMIARGDQVFDNEISKVYYYLRAGVPTVSEQFISTNSLITETEWGEVTPYGDVSAMAEAVVRWVDAAHSRRSEIGESVAQRHSWDRRAKIYHQLFQEALESNEL